MHYRIDRSTRKPLRGWVEIQGHKTIMLAGMCGLWLGGMLLGAVQPPERIGFVAAAPLTPALCHRAAHVILVLLAAFCLERRIESQNIRGILKCSVMAFCLSLGIGLLTESSQLLVPGRSADWADYLHDIQGSLAGAAFYLLIRFSHPKGQENPAKSLSNPPKRLRKSSEMVG